LAIGEAVSLLAVNYRCAIFTLIAVSEKEEAGSHQGTAQPSPQAGVSEAKSAVRHQIDPALATENSGHGVTPK
jgi:hypothetical protein